MVRIAGISAEEIAQVVGKAPFSGVVSLATLGDGPSLDLAFGFADRGHRVRNTVETRFAMASGCKAFTAVAIGLLIQDGMIGLDTALADCVRSRQFHFGSQVTVGQLLNHTAGIPDYFSEEADSDYAALWRERPCYRMTSVRDFLPLFETAPMKAPPGRGFVYCNAGFVLLALVVEELTGRDFREVVAERIFRPCGMTRSGYFAMMPCRTTPPSATCPRTRPTGAATSIPCRRSAAATAAPSPRSGTCAGSGPRCWPDACCGKRCWSGSWRHRSR